MSTVKIPKDEIWFAKLKESAIIPTKRKEDAGYDIYPAFDKETIVIPPHTTCMIETGIMSAFSDEYAIILKERGSTGSKGIGQRCGVIDSGYRGEWLVPITNHNDYPLYITKLENLHISDAVIYPYKKAICQAILVPVINAKSIEKTTDELLNIESERGNGKLGSSGK